MNQPTKREITKMAKRFFHETRADVEKLAAKRTKSGEKIVQWPQTWNDLLEENKENCRLVALWILRNKGNF